MNPPTEAILKKLKVMKNNAVYRYCWNEEHNNMSQDCVDERDAMEFAVACAEWLMRANDSESDITERIRQSMLYSPIITDKKYACEFLSKLSMYDENGQLVKYNAEDGN